MLGRDAGAEEHRSKFGSNARGLSGCALFHAAMRVFARAMKRWMPILKVPWRIVPTPIGRCHGQETGDCAHSAVLPATNLAKPRAGGSAAWRNAIGVANARQLRRTWTGLHDNGTVVVAEARPSERNHLFLVRGKPPDRCWNDPPWDLEDRQSSASSPVQIRASRRGTTRIPTDRVRCCRTSHRCSSAPASRPSITHAAAVISGQRRPC